MEKSVQQIDKKIIILDRHTGEIVEAIPPGGTAELGRYRIMEDYSDVPSQTDQSQRDENNIALLVQKYKPDELAHLLAAKYGHKQEINNYDFSQEPDHQEAMNIVYRIREEFNSLPEQIKYLFKGKPSEFLKFADNPQNLKQLVEWGLAEKIEKIKQELNPSNAKPNANEDKAPQS